MTVFQSHVVGCRSGVGFRVGARGWSGVGGERGRAPRAGTVPRRPRPEWHALRCSVSRTRQHPSYTALSRQDSVVWRVLKLCGSCGMWRNVALSCQRRDGGPAAAAARAPLALRLLPPEDQTHQRWPGRLSRRSCSVSSQLYLALSKP